MREDFSRAEGDLSPLARAGLGQNTVRGPLRETAASGTVPSVLGALGARLGSLEDAVEFLEKAFHPVLRDRGPEKPASGVVPSSPSPLSRSLQEVVTRLGNQIERLEDMARRVDL